MTKLETLKQALDGRNEEILNYQINIDNFDLAIKKIEVEYPDNEDLKDFKRSLIELLDGNKKQQLRSIIIRDVIEEQVKELSKN
tara:strand:+ start:2537 stop:2788 length:252 start_codon:yes stop_codon:yes gene_type:complete